MKMNEMVRNQTRRRLISAIRKADGKVDVKDLIERVRCWEARKHRRYGHILPLYNHVMDGKIQQIYRSFMKDIRDPSPVHGLLKELFQDPTPFIMLQDEINDSVK